MFRHAFFKNNFLVAILVATQTQAPVLAVEGLGQSGWVTPGSSPQGHASGGSTGQSGWVVPGQSAGQASGGASGLAQSGWVQPGHLQAAPRAQASAKGTLGQSDWVSQNRAMAAAAKSKATASRQSDLGRSSFTGAPESASEDISCAATLAPTRVSEQEPMLQGEVSQADIVDDSMAFYGANTAKPGNGYGVHPKQQPAAESVGEPVSAMESGCSVTPMGSPVNSMDMMGGMMALPMMMAASMNMLGQNFGGGFRGYGPGAGGVAVRMTPGRMGIGLGSYMAGRVVNRAIRGALNGTAVRVRF